MADLFFIAIIFVFVGPAIWGILQKIQGSLRHHHVTPSSKLQHSPEGFFPSAVGGLKEP